MSRRKGKIRDMALRYALLGLLAQQPASGYDLMRTFDRNLKRYAWHARQGQIYPELAQLLDEGLVEVVAEGPRRRRVYGPTDQGREALREWMLAAPGELAVRNEHVLRLLLLPTLAPADARVLLEQSAAGAAREAAALRSALDGLRAQLGEAPLPPEAFGAELGARWFEALVTWSEWALAELDAQS
jgi:DNA-binding PadR family transcriptional regulator